MTVRAARGDRTILPLVPQIRPHWHKEGLIPITVGPALIEFYAQMGDIDQVLAEHDRVVEAMTVMWREFFHARVRLGAVTIGALAGSASTLATAERDRVAREAARVLEGARRTLALQAEEATHWGPEGMAWAARLSAEHLRFRWLAGVDSPEEPALIEAWRNALGRFEDYGHVWEIARCQARLAAVLQATGELGEARALADKARETARKLGAEPLLAELRGLGGASGRRASQAGPANQTLTARESEILKLVAEGRTNGEIGKQLFISTKTVSVHVSNILAKLGASGRTEAAAIARRTGLI
jgi:DNA-binding CsgD family transcriptional regulator